MKIFTNLVSTICNQMMQALFSSFEHDVNFQGQTFEITVFTSDRWNKIKL